MAMLNPTTQSETNAIPAGYKRTEVGIIPEDWDVKSLKKIGNFFKGSGIKRDDVTDEGVFCIRYGEIYTRYDSYVQQPLSRIPLAVAATAFSLLKGDLLFAGSGETAEEIGKCIAYWGEEESYAGGDIIILRPVYYNSLYLGYLLNTNIVVQQKSRLGQGDAVVHISAHNLAQVKIPLPRTNAEQDAIAEALFDTDALITALDRLIAKKRAIKQATMQQLLTGKTRLPGFDGEWEFQQLGKLGRIFGGMAGKSKKDFVNGNVQYIPFLNIILNPVIDINNLEWVNISAGESQNKVQYGDLFFNGSSETPEEVGLCAALLTKLSDVYLNSFCFGFRLFNLDTTDPLFLAYYFRSQEGRKSMYALAQGATRYNLPKNKFLALQLLLPSIDEQRAIATVLSDMDAELHALEQRRAKTIQIKQGMMQQLLTGRIRLRAPLAEEDA